MHIHKLATAAAVLRLEKI